MTDTEVMKQGTQAVQTERTPETETIYVPNVDISESSECIRLMADMPGVDEKSVDVSVANNVLTLEGHVHVDGPVGYQMVGEEYGVGKYRRDFTLSNTADKDSIKARVKFGTLEVTIPKKEETRTRRIKISS